MQRKKILRSVFAVLTAVVIFIPSHLSDTFNSIRNTDAANTAYWKAMGDGIFQDPLNGDIILKQYDKDRTSDIYYYTEGYTISDVDAYGNMRTCPNHPNGHRFDLYFDRAAFGDPDLNASAEDQNGIRTRYFRIPLSVIEQAMREYGCEDWYDEIKKTYSGEIKQTLYMQFDSIIKIHNPAKYGRRFEGFSGQLAKAIPTTGNSTDYVVEPRPGSILYTKDNWNPDLLNAESWTSKTKEALRSHYNKIIQLTELINDAEKPEKPADTGSEVGKVHTIGKQDPDFLTYNYPVDSKYKIGQTESTDTYPYITEDGDTVMLQAAPGIPTSEEIVNGYRADSWYGYADFGIKKVTKTFTFTGRYTYRSFEGYHDVDSDGDGVDDKFDVPKYSSVTTDYSKTVSRTLSYWFIGNADFYDLRSVETSNEVFPETSDGRVHRYSSHLNTFVTCMIDGKDAAAELVAMPNYGDDSYHVSVPEYNSNVSTGTAYSSKDDALNALDSIVSERMNQIDNEMKVRNDKLVVNSKTYMSDEWYNYREFKEEPENSDTAISAMRSYKTIIDTKNPDNDDYLLETEESTGKIPANTANKEYYTSVSAVYKGLLANSTPTKNHIKTPLEDNEDNSYDRIHATSEKNRIWLTDETLAAGIDYTNDDLTEELQLKDYFCNEPVYVHTPTVSPAIITNAAGGGGNSNIQLVDSAKNTNADYQLLLDDTYSIEFVPKEHLEHLGYKDQSEDLYNKYCAFKQVCFSFDVQLDGDIYKVDDSDVDCNGNKKLAGYTKWIDLEDFYVNDFYIPSWAEESAEHMICFRVAPENIIDQNGVNHIDDTEYLANTTFNGKPLYNYVATYTMTVQVSGRIYGFQAVGIQDKDNFKGPQDDGTSWGLFGVSQYYPFCPSYEEKRSGTRNRLGGSIVRYTVDGSLEYFWNPLNTLPFSRGRSEYNPSQGTLKRGSTFAFTLRTIANLWDETDDYIVITPTFRYVSMDGQQNENIDVYYSTVTPDGKNKMSYIEYGSDIDRQMVKQTSISDTRFDGSYYTEDLSINRTIPQDDAEFSRQKTNEYIKETKGIDNYYKNTNAYLRRISNNYCLSQIKLDNRLRLLTGNLEELGMNLDYAGADLKYLDDKTDTGVSYKLKETDDPDNYWEGFRMSMQTWFGTYYIPNQLYVTDGTFEADADGDGQKETYDNLDDYINAKGYIEGNEDFFKKDGYLIVNFDIITYKDGKPHLKYKASNCDQWSIEGQPTTTEVGDPDVGEEITIPVKPGDVAVVDIGKSTSDRYYVGFNRIN